MASSDKFCLKWNDFENNISQAFCELRDEKDFFDVTLVCGESQVSAHKVILAASSQFFRNILKANPHQHPLLYLRGVKHHELLSILSFMYKGQVNIAQEELSSFLSVAEDLQVRGLSHRNQERQDLKAKAQSASQSQRNTIKHIAKVEKTTQAPATGSPGGVMSDLVSSNTPRPSPATTQPLEEDDIVEYFSEAASTAAKQGSLSTEAAEEMEENFSIRSEYHDQFLPSQDQENPPSQQEFVNLIQSKMFRVAGELAAVWRCSECSYSSKVKCNVSQHIEARHIHHSGYYCFICNKTCPSKNAFRMHNKRNHENSKDHLYQ